LEKKSTDSEKRKALAAELDGYITEIENTLKKCEENNYITNIDTAMLLRRMAQMHKELYSGYEEFSEVNMRFKELEDIGMDKYDKVVADYNKAVAEAEKKGLSRTAKAMKAGGEAIDKIMRYTGLSQHEIMAL
jgi:ribosome-binding protein aMBF1 (putative translation factor)